MSELCLFTPESGHVQCTSPCPLSAKSGHVQLLDYFIGSRKHLAWDGEPECLCRFEIDRKLILG